MKVLWLTTIPGAGSAGATGNARRGVSGGWVDALASVIQSSFPALCLRIMRPSGLRGMGDAPAPFGNGYDLPWPSTHYLYTPSSELCAHIARTVNEFQPDVIHTHGTEHNLGLACSVASPRVPTVLSIQGLLGECAKVYLGGLSVFDIVRSRTIRDWIRLDGLVEQRWKFYRRSRLVETEVLRRAKHVIGRTTWDRAHIMEFSGAEYHSCDEVLRPDFTNAAWQLEGCRRHSIVCSFGPYPLKGFHTLLDAAASLCIDFPDLQISVPNFWPGGRGVLGKLRRTGYESFIENKIKERRLGGYLRLLPALGAADMARELEMSHVYVLPSFVENSSNSLCEAMCVGTPTVAAFTGGIPSLVTDGIDALCFGAGDDRMLEYQIRSVFSCDSLAKTISTNARRKALARHNPDAIAVRLFNIYEKITRADVGRAAASTCHR